MSRPPHSLPPQDDAPPEPFDDGEDDSASVVDGTEDSDSGVDLAFDVAASGARLAAGAAVIHAVWKTLPNGPGVYRMIGSAGDVLYVGKARSLKKRVASYARGVGHSNRIARMIAETTAIHRTQAGRPRSSTM